MIPKVSVTVPVYNTSKYLRQCLDSLANQSLKELEIIVVDDGSTDDSGVICDEYANNYPNFKVIHQQNGGLAAARQTGLENATGEYIIVCDSDDWAELDMYERLYHVAKESDADMVLCGYFAEYGDGRSVPKQKWFKHLDFEGHMKELFGSGYNNSWIRLIKRNIYTDYNINYEKGINMGEDGLILYKIMLTHPKLAQINAKLYHYRKEFGGSSYTNRPSMNQLSQIRKVHEWIKHNYNTVIFSNGLYKLNLNYVFAALRAHDCDYNYLERYLKEEMYWKDFYRNKKSMKAIMVYAAKLFSVSLISKVLKKLYKYVY